MLTRASRNVSVCLRLSAVCAAQRGWAAWRCTHADRLREIWTLSALRAVQRGQEG